MRRHRIFGAGAVVPALAALLLAVPARAVEPDKLLPNDTETVFTINVKQIVTSPLLTKTHLVDKAKEALKDQAEAHQVLTDLGFDPFTDFDSLTVAGCGGSETDKGLVIVHGKFDTAKIKAKAEEVAKDMENVLKIHKVPDGSGGMIELYETTLPAPGGAPQALFVALVGKNTLVASPGKDYVLDAIDKQAGKKKSQLKNKALQELLTHIDGDQSLWLAVLGDTLLKSPLASNDDAKEVFEKLSDATAGITFGKDLKLAAAVTAKNDDDAKVLGDKMRKGLNQAVGAAMLFGGGNEQLAPLIDILKAVKPKIKGKVIGVEVAVPGEDIENAIKKNQ
jgi:hypothetical protein